MPQPHDWIERATHGRPVVFLGANMNTSSAQATLYEAEFWNPSIVRQWTIDGLDPPIPTQTPDSDARGYLYDGQHRHIAPQFDYFLTTQDVDLNGDRLVSPDVPTDQVTQLDNQGYVLWRVHHPVRLAHTVRGLTRDGWASSPDGQQPAVVSYSQFVTPGYRNGQIAVTASRAGGCGKTLPDEHVVIRIGKFGLRDNTPVITKLQTTLRFTLKACDTHTEVLPRRGLVKAPFQVLVSITPTYRLSDYDARSSESRWLAAQVGFDFIGLDPAP
jgi:hypothetical protein